MSHEWISEFGAAITVTDRDGKIISMNEKAKKTFEKYGGAALIGKSLMDCHNSKSQAMIADFLKNPKANSYTIEKAGIKKLVHQSPWFEKGMMAGLVEISIEIPVDMPHFVRT